MSQEKRLAEEFDKQVSELDKVNLMVVGGTGVGKSSLINRVFGKKVAKTGTGKPVTHGCHRYESEDIPVVIYDTEGYEIIDGEIQNSNFTRNVVSEIDRLSQLELKQHIHLFWYCISANNHRVTDYDIENIRALQSRNANLAVVITQCDDEEIDDNNEGVTSKAFKKVLKDEGIDSRVFETSAMNTDSLELDSLVEWSVDSLPDEKLRDAFVGAQKTSVSLKEKEARNAIAMASSAAAAAAGVNPFPMSDSVALMPIQMALAARLANIYGFKALDTAAMALLKSQLLSMLGKQMAASLLKLIPVLGQVINGAVAAAITAGFGYALNSAYKSAYIKLLETGEMQNWTKLFEKVDFLHYIKREKELKGV